MMYHTRTSQPPFCFQLSSLSNTRPEPVWANSPSHSNRKRQKVAAFSVSNQMNAFIMRAYLIPGPSRCAQSQPGLHSLPSPAASHLSLWPLYPRHSERSCSLASSRNRCPRHPHSSPAWRNAPKAECFSGFALRLSRACLGKPCIGIHKEIEDSEKTGGGVRFLSHLCKLPNEIEFNRRAFLPHAIIVGRAVWEDGVRRPEQKSTAVLCCHDGIPHTCSREKGGGGERASLI